MNSFWPSGLEVDDVSSPMEILEAARSEWDDKSGGVLTLILEETESQGGYPLINVHAEHNPTQRTVALFSVIHQKRELYPATIKPKSQYLPPFLRKEYYDPGLLEVDIDDGGMTGRTVTNDWVSETPSEFRENLEDAFNLPYVKTAMFNLLTGGRANAAGHDSARPSEGDVGKVDK